MRRRTVAPDVEAPRRWEALLHDVVLVLIAIAVTGAASLLLLQSFRPVAWTAPFASLAWLAWRHRGLLGSRASLPSVLAAVIATVLLLQGGLLHHENIHIGRDEGVYAMQAWTFALEEQAGFDQPHRRTWIGVDDAAGFAGGAPIFPPAYAVLLAIGSTWAGGVGMDAVDGVLAALAALLLYAVARRLMPAWWALAPVAFFAVFHGTVWFSRTYASENLLLVLLLGACSFLLSARPWAGGVVVAAMLLTRVDAILYPITYLVAAGVLRESAESPRSRAGAAVATIGVLALWLAWSIRIDPGYVVSHLRLVPTLLIDLIVPQAAPLEPLGPAGAAGPASPAYNLRRLVQWGLGPLLLLGGAYVALTRPSRPAAAVLVFGSAGLVYVLHAAISPDLPFYYRRFYPGLVPVVILLGFAALAAARPRRLQATPALAAGALIAIAAVTSLPLWTFTEWQDLPDQLDALAAGTPAGSSILLPPGQPGGFAAYLEMQAGVPAVYMRSVPPGLPPGSPMTLQNWATFIPPGTTPLLASEISPDVAAREPVSPYVRNEDVEHVALHRLASPRLHRVCDLAGAFYGNATQDEATACGRGPPVTREAWSIELHLYGLAAPPSPVTPRADDR